MEHAPTDLSKNIQSLESILATIDEKFIYCLSIGRSLKPEDIKGATRQNQNFQKSWQVESNYLTQVLQTCCRPPAISFCQQKNPTQET